MMCSYEAFTGFIQQYSFTAGHSYDMYTVDPHWFALETFVKGFMMCYASYSS